MASVSEFQVQLDELKRTSVSHSKHVSSQLASCRDKMTLLLTQWSANHITPANNNNPGSNNHKDYSDPAVLAAAALGQ